LEYWVRYQLVASSWKLVPGYALLAIEIANKDEGCYAATHCGKDREKTVLALFLNQCLSV